MSDLSKRISRLRKQIKKYNDLYYKQGISVVTDYEFDMLHKELESLENEAGANSLFSSDGESSPAGSVGSDLSENFKKIRHKNKMLSISNSYSKSDLLEFDERTRKLLGSVNDLEYCVEYKIDGVAVSAVFRNGELSYAATRGDGQTGDDITENFRNVKNVPHRIEGGKDFEIRGEIYFRKDDFSLLNREREVRGLELFANARNAAAGSLKLLDKTEAEKRPLSLICYYFDGEGSAATQSGNLELLQKLSFPTSGYFRICNGISEVIEECEHLEKSKNSLDFDIDGAVIKLNDIALRSELGDTSKSPRWVMAYKFKPDTAETLLKDIVFQVGRTGVVTPVAVLEPVHISGTVVKRATLHNFDEIAGKDIRKGDYVYLEKAGEIIPKITGVNKSKRPEKTESFRMIEKCPVCCEKLIRPDDEVAFRCINSSCPAQIERQIAHFAGRGAMDIEGMGPQVVSNLMSAGLLNSVADIYSLDREKISGLERMGEISAGNLIRSIEKSKSRSLENLIFGLGIRHIGKEASLSLARNYKTIDAVMKASSVSLAEIGDIGEIMAGSTVSYFSLPKNIELIENLKSAGVNTEYLSSKNSADPFFEGKVFVITGSFENISRDRLREIILSNNGKVSSSVSKSTDLLICGNDPGSKLSRAQEYGIRVMQADELREILE